MIKHVVVAAARPGTPDADVDELVAAWRALADRISDVESLTVGRDLGFGDGRFTLAAVAVSSVDAWRRIMAHPEHDAFRRLGARVLDRETLAAVQFEL